MIPLRFVFAYLLAPEETATDAPSRLRLDCRVRPKGTYTRYAPRAWTLPSGTAWKEHLRLPARTLFTVINNCSRLAALPSKSPLPPLIQSPPRLFRTNVLIPMQPIISISKLFKTYASGLVALKDINLEIRRGEIFALLGPNGAGKTTLISIVCGIVNASTGTVLADGHDIVRDYRAARAKIGLVPQELSTDAFETVWATVSFSRGLFGKAPDPAHLEKVLRDLSLWEKKDSKIMALSGGMKRRVLIAKALAHEPQILFLDEPTAGVDVELRRDMWQMVRNLREAGVTIILTTHYIEEAEEMADRIGVISNGELIVVEDKHVLMRKL